MQLIYSREDTIHSALGYRKLLKRKQQVTTVPQAFAPNLPQARPECSQDFQFSQWIYTDESGSDFSGSPDGAFDGTEFSH